MVGVVMAGRLLERDADLINIISFSGLVILIWNPQYLFELGFQLSFAATLSIVYLHDRLAELCFPFLSGTSSRWLRWVVSGLSVSLAAQLGTWPIIAYHFQKLPVISLLANLLVVPLVGLAVSLGFASLLLSPLSVSLARLYAAANWLVLNTLMHIVRLASRLPFSCLTIPRPSLLWVVLYYTFALLGANLKRSRAASRTFLFAGLCVLNLLIWHQALMGEAQMKVLFFDVAQGDAALVRFPNGRTMLVDGGERKMGWDCGEQILCPYFHRVGIDRLDVVVLTHADNDHVGGLAAVLEKMSVGLVLDSGARHLSSTYLRFLALANSPDLSYHLVRAGDVLHIDNRVEVQVLHPTEQFVAQDGRAPLGLNNGSVVLRLQYGAVSFLLTGDIEEQAEGAMLRDGRVESCTVLKVPHHGSISSSVQPFLDALRPRVAIISVGQENKFGHPHEDVLRRYRRLNVIVRRTDQHGAVLIETDGRVLWLNTTVEREKRRLSLPEGVAETS
jgi:competence protein ComEC